MPKVNDKLYLLRLIIQWADDRKIILNDDQMIGLRKIVMNSTDTYEAIRHWSSEFRLMIDKGAIHDLNNRLLEDEESEIPEINDFKDRNLRILVRDIMWELSKSSQTSLQDLRTRASKLVDETKAGL